MVFSDIVGFTTISQTFTPLKVAQMLDRLYLAFDELARKHKVFKVETIGDAYMGVTNLEGNEFDTHAKQIALFALEAIGAANTILIDEDKPELGHIRIRVGFHSGPVVSNVIGSLNPRFGLFGVSKGQVEDCRASLSPKLTNLLLLLFKKGHGQHRKPNGEQLY